VTNKIKHGQPKISIRKPKQGERERERVGHRAGLLSLRESPKISIRKPKRRSEGWGRRRWSVGETVVCRSPREMGRRSERESCRDGVG
jgi:hypothetical protein